MCATGSPKVGLRCCITAVTGSVIMYILSVVLGWSFAEGLPHHFHSTVTPLKGAILVSLPVAAIIAGVCFACILQVVSESWCDEERVNQCQLGSMACSVILGGVCSVFGGIFLLAAAADPPTPERSDPQGYSAFAAIAGIVACISGIIYCCALCGICMKYRNKIMEELSETDHYSQF